MALLRTLFGFRRFPGPSVALAAAAAIVAIAVCAGSVFLDATESATLFRLMEVDRAERLPTVAIEGDSTIAADLIGYRTQLLEEELGSSLGDPIVTAHGDVVPLRANGEQAEGRILSRTGALDHVAIEGDPASPGVWLADVVAAELEIGPGDEVVLGTDPVVARVPVAGTYRDLFGTTRTPFWASLDDLIYPAPGSDTRPPPLMLFSLEDYVAVEHALRDDQDPLSWEFVLPVGPMSTTETEVLDARLDAFSSSMTDATTELAAAFRQVNRSEPLSGWIEQSDGVVDQVASPVRALSSAATVLALGVLAGAGVFVVRRRRTEFSLLHVRGIGPLRVGLRSAGEAFLPVAAGAALGFAAGVLLAGGLASDGVVDAASVRRAAVDVAVVAGIAVVLLGGVAAWSMIDVGTVDRGGVRRVASRVPWELLVLVLAGFAAVGLREGGSDTSSPIDAAFTLFPILILAGLVGLAARGIRLVLPRLRRWGTDHGTAVYLATRRLTAASRAVMVLIVVMGVASGILVYAGTLAASLAASAEESAGLTVGSDVAVSFVADEGVDLDVTGGDDRTVVGRIERGTLGDDGAAVDVLVIDPSTFASSAFWQDGYADRPLDELVRDLEEPPDPRVPVLVGGGGAPLGDSLLAIPGFDIPVRVVDSTVRFPGMVGDRPLVVVDRDTLRVVLDAAGLQLRQFVRSTEVWGKGSEEEVREAVSDSGAVVLSSLSARSLRDSPAFLAIGSMLRLVIALGAIAATVILIVAALYLDARQRQADVSYALSRRMGLTGGASRRSLAIEIGGLLGTAAALGAAIAVAASALVAADVQRRVVDVSAPVLRLPLMLALTMAIALVAFAIGASFVVQRRTDHADVAEVMRGAD